MKQWIESVSGGAWVLPTLPRGRAWKVTGEVRVEGPRSWLEVEEVDTGEPPPEVTLTVATVREDT